MSQSPADRFDTAALRAAVLESWRTSPTRYREDANVEEDYALGGYRDRLLVELVQNAVDAARALGVPARLRLQLDDAQMVLANTGAPLDRAGVESLASMRASAKRDEATVGRFGAGFAAVLSATDRPAIASRGGGVRFSSSDTASLLQADPQLAVELQRRSPPTLRLPFPFELDADLLELAVEGEYETVVVLPWRDESARARATDALRDLDDALFIAFPDLVELTVDGGPSGVPTAWTASVRDGRRTVAADGATRHWSLHQSTGEWAPDDLADRPTEERARRSWSITWAVPVSDAGVPVDWPNGSAPGWPARVVHAPTPTDEVLELPALLVGDLPVDPSRRRLATGAVTEVLLDAAAAGYVDVVRHEAARTGAVAAALVPGAQLVGPVDGRIREQVRDQLGRIRWLPRAHDGSLASPRELVTVTPPVPELVAVLAPHVVDLLAADWSSQLPALQGLGLTTRRWSDVWDVVATVPLSPQSWHDVYAAAAGLDRASLEGLPVRLADGRVAREVRQCLVPGEIPAEAAALLGLPVIDPAATHRLLERLGAGRFDPARDLVSVPGRVADAVRLDQAEARDLLDAVVCVLAAAGARAGELVELGATPVPTESGDWRPAARVVLPTSPLAAVAAADQLLETALASEHSDGWLALGVLDTPTVVTVHDEPLDRERWDQLMVDGADWCEVVADVVGAASLDDVVVTAAALVRGVELVDRLETTAAFDLLRTHEVRAALVAPATVIGADGRTRLVPAPAAWWLSEASVLDGRAPVSLRLPGDDRLAPFFDAVDLPAVDDVELFEAIGVHTTLERWLATPDGVAELLSAMVADDARVGDADVPPLYRALDACEVDPDTLDPPARVLAKVSGGWRPVDAAEVVVAVAPHHAYVMNQPFVPGSGSLADLLDVDVSDDRSCDAGDLAGTGQLRPVSDEVASSVSVKEYREHESLAVGGVELDWWVTDGAEVHACTVDGLARGLAWASGQWGRRHELAARLMGGADPERESLDATYDD